MATNAGELIAKGTGYGVAGWVIENALCPQDKYSAVFRGLRVPFLPIYAINGLVLTGAAPYVSKWPALSRGLAYGVLGTAVEYLGCQIDRKFLATRGPSWDYGRSEALSRASEGCVSFTRSALWAGFGLVAEKFR